MRKLFDYWSALRERSTSGVHFLVMIVLLSGAQLHAKSLEDMLNRSVVIPDKVNKIYASSPILLYSLIAVDRSKVAGLNFPFQQGEAKYLDKEIVNLPVLGGWFGQGRTPNSEMILGTAPDVILLSDYQKNWANPKSEQGWDIRRFLSFTSSPVPWKILSKPFPTWGRSPVMKQGRKNFMPMVGIHWSRLKRS